MATNEEIRAFCGNLESDRVERTVSLKDTDKFCEAACAFSNDLPHHNLPGYLLLGVRDDGSLGGIKIGDEVLRGLGGIRSDGNILPPPSITVARHSYPDGDVVAVEVRPSDLPPVRYRGRIWVRVGPRKAIATEQEERILTERRASVFRSFDTAPCLDSRFEDLSLRLFTEYRGQYLPEEEVRTNHRTEEEQLASLRCYDMGRHCPTNGGILLFGTNPRFYLPGAYVQFLRFPGTEMADTPLDQQEISGDLRTLLDLLREKATTHIVTALERRNGFQEKSVPDYPETALREILHNAVLHRDYQSNTPVRFHWFADRMEIQSPGGLFGEVTAETMTRRSSYRNPLLAEAMKTMGYVNRFGYGIQRAQKLLSENGNPPAEFQVDDRVVGVTIRRRQP